MRDLLLTGLDPHFPACVIGDGAVDVRHFLLAAADALDICLRTGLDGLPHKPLTYLSGKTTKCFSRVTLIEDRGKTKRPPAELNPGSKK